MNLTHLGIHGNGGETPQGFSPLRQGINGQMMAGFTQCPRSLFRRVIYHSKLRPFYGQFKATLSLPDRISRRGTSTCQITVQVVLVRLNPQTTCFSPVPEVGYFGRSFSQILTLEIAQFPCMIYGVSGVLGWCRHPKNFLIYPPFFLIFPHYFLFF